MFLSGQDCLEKEGKKKKGGEKGKAHRVRETNNSLQPLPRVVFSNALLGGKRGKKETIHKQEEEGKRRETNKSALFRSGS